MTPLSRWRPIAPEAFDPMDPPETRREWVAFTWHLLLILDELIPKLDDSELRIRKEGGPGHYDILDLIEEDMQYLAVGVRRQSREHGHLLDLHSFVTTTRKDLRRGDRDAAVRSAAIAVRMIEGMAADPFWRSNERVVLTSDDFLNYLLGR